MTHTIQKPLAFVTNDDGIHTLFLHELVHALQKDFEVCVVAPKKEQSWVGRAVSRGDDIEVQEFPGLGCSAWTVDGTPTDCSNIGLSHLCPRKPDIVISGINLGFNYAFPMILSSGTVAGAIEGALWGIPALALSKAIPKEEFEKTRLSGGKLNGLALEGLRFAAVHSRVLALQVMKLEPEGISVHNVNFPEVVTSATPIVKTYPAKLNLGPLFQKNEEHEDTYEFSFKATNTNDEDPSSDLFNVKRGFISHSVLDYSRLCPDGSAYQFQ